MYNDIKKFISDICMKEYNFFLNKKYVVGIGCGYKITGNFNTDNLCIQVFVIKKESPTKLLPKDVIPPMYKGITTDVIESGEFIACSLRNRVRPVLGGYSISSELSQINGTAGCLVTNGVLTFILSTNHTLANLNIQPVGKSIIQPAFIYGGRPPKDIVATLHRYVPIRFIEGASRPINFSDCATGLETTRNIISPEIALIGRIRGLRTPVLNEQVQKVGATSELTHGTIMSVSVTFVLTYSNEKRCLLQDQIFTSQMAEQGDSGSILINKNKFAIGLLCGKSNIITCYNRLDRALDQLDVQLVT